MLPVASAYCVFRSESYYGLGDQDEGPKRRALAKLDWSCPQKGTIFFNPFFFFFLLLDRSLSSASGSRELEAALAELPGCPAACWISLICGGGGRA